MRVRDAAHWVDHRTFSIALACVEPALHAATLSIEASRGKQAQQITAVPDRLRVDR